MARVTISSTTEIDSDKAFELNGKMKDGVELMVELGLNKRNFKIYVFKKGPGMGFEIVVKSET